MDKCPQCGYSETPKPSFAQMVMNYYVQKENPKRVIVCPHTEVEFVGVQGEGDSKKETNWVLESKWKELYETEWHKSQLKAAKETFKAPENKAPAIATEPTKVP